MSEYESNSGRMNVSLGDSLAVFYSILSTFCKRGLKHKQYIPEATSRHDSILINTAASSCCICSELMAVIFIYLFNACYFFTIHVFLSIYNQYKKSISLDWTN